MCILDLYWFGLVLTNVCKREMLGFKRNAVKTPVLVLAID